MLTAEACVYTVSMSKQSAILLLAVVVLWTAVPAFACLMPTQHHACCQQMTQDCSTTMGADSSCCQAHLPQSNFPPARDLGADRLAQFASDPVSATLVIPVVLQKLPVQAATAPPPLTLSSNSVLRI